MTPIKFILQVTLPYRRYILGTFFVFLIISIISSLQPYLLKLLIDAINNKDKTIGVAQLKKFVPLFISSYILFQISFRVSNWLGLKYEMHVKTHINTILMQHLVLHDYHFFQNHFSGSLSSKVSSVADAVPSLVKIFLQEYLFNFLFITISFFMLYQIHLGFSLALCAWCVFMMYFSLYTLKRYRMLTEIVVEKSASIIGSIIDILGNIISVKLFSSKKLELQQLDITQNDYLDASIKRRWFLLKYNMVQSGSFLLYQIFCLLMLMHLFQNNAITAGDFALVLTLNIKIIDHIWMLTDRMRDFNESLGTLTAALKTFYVSYGIKDKENARELSVKKGSITFRSVGFHYSNSPLLFEDVTLTIQGGEKIGLVGYSGSGKTTFIHLLLRLFDSVSGEICIDEQDIKEVTQESLHRAIALIPQDTSLFHRSLMENIRYGRKDASDAEVIEAAEEAQAHDFIMQLSKKYNTLVGERGIKLSGGQRQRIAIARAFLKKAPILILDEATSHLDSVTENEIQETLDSIIKDSITKQTMIVIAHRLTTLLHMDRILVFDKGKIVEQGTHTALLSQQGLYKKLWEAQSHGFLPKRDVL